MRTLDLLTYAGTLTSLSDVLDHPSHTFVEGDVCAVEEPTQITCNMNEMHLFDAETGRAL